MSQWSTKVSQRPPFLRQSTRLIVGVIAVTLSYTSSSEAKQLTSQCASLTYASKSQESTEATSSSTNSYQGLFELVDPRKSFQTEDFTDFKFGKVYEKTLGLERKTLEVSAGNGPFPSGIQFVTGQRSDLSEIGNHEVPIWGPGAPSMGPFGFGTFHNLDVRFITGWESFGDKQNHSAQMVYVSVGKENYIFELCSNGKFVSSLRDGSSLHGEPAAGGGFPYSILTLFLANGDAIRMAPMESGDRRWCFSELRASMWLACGNALSWRRPNGDFASFEYENFYLKPDALLLSHLNRSPNFALDAYKSSKSICVTTVQNGSECRDVQSTHYMQYPLKAGQKLIIRNRPIYSQRLLRVSTSRGYSLEFSYLDPTTAVGSVCSDYSSSTGYICLPRANEDLSREIVKDVTLKKDGASIEVVHFNGLNSKKGDEEPLIRFELDGNYREANKELLKVYMRGEDTPIRTYHLTYQDGALFEMPPTSSTIEEGGPRLQPAQHRFKKYLRVEKVAFRDNGTIEYKPDFKYAWTTFTSHPSGNTQPESFWIPQLNLEKLIVIDSAKSTSNLTYLREDQPVEIVRPDNSVERRSYDDTGKNTGVILPSGQKIENTFDRRGNLVKVIKYSSLSNLDKTQEETRFIYNENVDSFDCPSKELCNKPAATIDARGAVTAYTWKPWGDIESITYPADSDGLSRKKTYSYLPVPLSNNQYVNLTDEIDDKQGSISVITKFFYRQGDGSLRGVVERSGQTSRVYCYKQDVFGRMSERKRSGNVNECS